MKKRRVPSEVYDRDYLLSENTEGYEDFKSGSLSHVKQLQLDLLELGPATTLLEVGLGRGEFLLHCAKRGAVVAGIDYSESAIDIARSTLAAVPEADLRTADCKALPFDSDSFQRVYAGDVLEHQDIEDGAVMLQEMYRVLEPGGFLLVHTAPNAIFMKVVYPIAKPILRLIDPGTVEALENHLVVNRKVHVHEYTTLSLRRVARMAGLNNAEIWIGEDLLRSSRHRHTAKLSDNRLVGWIGSLGRLRLVRFFLGNDLFLKVHKPAGKVAAVG
ncbi:MAG: class I SAM-dependent methyltransferase [Deltaproteobacteria bacterium]|nr:class I SAM-dependent methyltransferase [Deltaproteobacteria bacterium]